MTNQPKALRVAHELECRALINEISLDDDFVMELDAARLLREQHAEIERLRAEVLAEREACAQIVDANAAACANNSMLQDVLRGNAAAIRARGE